MRGARWLAVGLVMLSACSVTPRTAPPEAEPAAGSSLADPTSGPPSTTPTPSDLFDGPFREVFRPGDRAWESLYVDPGALIAADGVLHMFYNGLSDWPANASVGHAVSTDGVAWVRLGGAPILSARDESWVGVSMFASDVAVLGDGRWALYFHAVERIQSPAGASIGMAVAPGPGGPWQFVDGPILTPGAVGAWDEIGVLNPSVVWFGGRWLMAYDAQRGDERTWGDRSIGIAVSEDGMSWTRASGPVLTATGEGWERQRVYDPNVVVDGDRLVMTYMTSVDDPNAGVQEFYVGLAVSDDGETWRRVGEGPILDVRRQGLGAVFLSSMERIGDDLRFLFDTRAADLSTRIWVLGHEGPLGA